MTSAPETLSGDRVRLRRWRDEDRAPFAAMNADPRVMEFFPSTLERTESDALADRIEAHFGRHGFGLWAVEVPGVAPFVGFTGLSVPHFDAAFMPCVEIGWRLAVDHWSKGYATEAARLALGYGFEALHYQLEGPHSVVSSWGGMAPPKDLNMVKPIERVLRSGLFGPWDKPDIDGLDPLPEGLNPARAKAWGEDSFVFFPNFMLLVWEPGWYLTYNYWPTSYNTHTFEGNLYFVPPKNATERLRQELAAVTFKEYALQDGNTLEATQRSIESRAVTAFPLNDQEVLLRHLHKTARDRVAEHQARQGETPVQISAAS